jgi:hypothetical protein
VHGAAVTQRDDRRLHGDTALLRALRRRDGRKQHRRLAEGLQHLGIGRLADVTLVRRDRGRIVDRQICRDERLFGATIDGHVRLQSGGGLLCRQSISSDLIGD